MTTVVISQPYLFPWPGLFEQIRLADVFVHYDDVAFSKGSLVNRVQLKTPHGPEWMTVPLAGRRFGHRIMELIMDGRHDWRGNHIDQLQSYYGDAPHCHAMLDIVQAVHECGTSRLVELLIRGLEVVCDYLGFGGTTQFFRSSQLSIAGRSSERVLSVVKHFGGDVYVTGHGAKNYLDHEAFEAEGVSVRYMNYQRCTYPQLHGSFDPHVSILDLIANCGREGKQHVCSSTVGWREFLARQRLAG